MTVENSVVASTLPRLSASEIEERVRQCPRLPSLSSVNKALRDLLHADNRYTAQIAEVIRRDPSLTARLLRLVNSVYFGLTTSINSIEEAVFFLGVRQIRQLAMVTPVIEDFQRLAGKVPFPWRRFWQHCIGTAILTREIIYSYRLPADELDYVAGLIHDVGRITMSAAFPTHFNEIQRRVRQTRGCPLEIEADVLGVDHAELGALYLKNHRLPEALVESARYHHAPEQATHSAEIVAAVQIADLLVRHAGIGESGNSQPVTDKDWMEASGWSMLLPNDDSGERQLACAGLKRSLDRLPRILEGLV